MGAANNAILTINGGSSSIKVALYEIGDPLQQLMHGELEHIGSNNTMFSYYYASSPNKHTMAVPARSNEAENYLIDWLEKEGIFSSVTAIGHRIVHGMQHTKPALITEPLMDELKKISAYDPEHLPGAIKLIELFQKKHPGMIQIACFDTAFHTSMPQVATILPIPRSYYKKGIRRYGFHGLSYTYLLEELERISGVGTARGRIIIAHLGSGSSIAAIKDGKSMDTSMGFTPTSGLPMSTRTGDLDPGVAWYLMQEEKMGAEAFGTLTNHQSGLLGVSETSSDMRALIKIKGTDIRASEAIDLFCYQTKKWIGSFAAVLGGLDTLIFSGGIGENAPVVRAGICAGLQFLGIELDALKNQNNQAIISTGPGRVTVRVIKTNEQLMIARMVRDVLKANY